MSVRTRMSISSKYFEFEINWAKRTALTCRDHILWATVRGPGVLTFLADGSYGSGHQRSKSPVKQWELKEADLVSKFCGSRALESMKKQLATSVRSFGV